MRITAFVLLAVVLCGCTTIQSTARTAPDGTKELTQKMTTTLGGKLKEGMTDFSAESVGADGSNWNVKSGQSGVGLTSPNTLRDLVYVIEAIAKLPALQAPVVEEAKPNPIEDFVIERLTNPAAR